MVFCIVTAINKLYRYDRRVHWRPPARCIVKLHFDKLNHRWKFIYNNYIILYDNNSNSLFN